MSLETCTCGEVIVLRCQGRIVRRQEAVALAGVVGELAQFSQRLVFDLGAVDAIDSAGLGELVLLHMWAEGSGCDLRFANPNRRVRRLFEITNLSAVFKVHAAVEEALRELHQEVA